MKIKNHQAVNYWIETYFAILAKYFIYSPIIL